MLGRVARSNAAGTSTDACGSCHRCIAAWAARHTKKYSCTLLDTAACFFSQQPEHAAHSPLRHNPGNRPSTRATSSLTWEEMLIRRSDKKMKSDQCNYSAPMCFLKRGTYEGGVSLIKSARACREIERGGDGRRLVCCAPRSRARRALARAQFVDPLYLSGPSSASVHCVSMLVPACGSRADTVSASASIRLGPSRPSHHTTPP